MTSLIAEVLFRAYIAAARRARVLDRYSWGGTAWTGQ